MASYGRLEYWNERYAREKEPCEWIGGSNLVEAILQPEILQYTSAPAPNVGKTLANHTQNGIVVTSLSTFPLPLYPAEDYSNMLNENHHRNERRVEDVKCSFPKQRKDVRILHLGCGNSEVGAQLLKRGYNNIVNVDNSYVLVKKMKEKYNHDFFVELHSCIHRENLLRYSLGLKPKLANEMSISSTSTEIPNEEARDEINVSEAEAIPTMTFELGDIAKGLNHPDESFDLIICKKTLDIILCGASSVADARKTIRECFRLLNKDHGVLVVLSSAKPEDRAVLFEQDDWTGVMNIKLPSKDDGHERKGHEKKKVESYAYILYKQQRFQTEM